MRWEFSLLDRFEASDISLTSGSSKEELLLTIPAQGVLAYSLEQQAGNLPKSHLPFLHRLGESLNNNKTILSELQAQTKGWSFGSSVEGVIAAAISNSEAYYVAVESSGGNQILRWANNGGILDISARFAALDAQLHSVHPTTASLRSSSDGEGTAKHLASTRHLDAFVVFKNGKIDLCSRGQLDSASQGVGSEGTVLAASSHLGTLAVVISEPPNKTTLAIYAVKDGMVIQLEAIDLPPPAGGRLTSLTVHSNNVTLLYSQGTVMTYAPTYKAVKWQERMSRRLAGFGDGAQPSSDTSKLPNGGPFLEHTDPTQLGKQRNEHDGVVAATSSTQVACVNWTSASAIEPEAGAGSRLRVTLLDSQHGAVCKTGDIAAADLKSGDTKLPLQATYLECRKLVILAGSAVVVVSIEEPAVTLASLVGSLSCYSGDVRAAPARAALHPEEWQRLQQPLRTKLLPTWLPGPDVIDSLDSELLGKEVIEIEPRHFQNTEQETTAAEEKLFKLHQKVRTPDSYTSKSKARKLTKEFVQLSKSEDLLQENLRLPEEQVAELLYQLSTRGYWDEVAAVWTEQPLRSHMSAPGLLPLLAEGHQNSQLSTMLRQGSFCSSQDLQQVVQTLLLGRANACDVQWHEALKGAARTACEKADREQPASSELLQEAADATALVHRFETRDIRLHPLLAGKVENRVLLEALGSLSSKDALVLFRYLQQWLQNVAELDASTDGCVFGSGAVLPPAARILQWLEALIDTHFIALAMSQASLQLVRPIHSIATDLSGGLTRLAQSLGVLEHIKCLAPLPKQPTLASQYAVELLDIGIDP